MVMGAFPIKTAFAAIKLKQQNICSRLYLTKKTCYNQGLSRALLHWCLLHHRISKTRGEKLWGGSQGCSGRKSCTGGGRRGCTGCGSQGCSGTKGCTGGGRGCTGCGCLLHCCMFNCSTENMFYENMFLKQVFRTYILIFCLSSTEMMQAACFKFSCTGQKVVIGCDIFDKVYKRFLCLFYPQICLRRPFVCQFHVAKALQNIQNSHHNFL